jgi:hypothetical protein
MFGRRRRVGLMKLAGVWMSDVARTAQGAVQVIVVFVVPLLIYFAKRKLAPARTVLYVFLVYAIWFISYSPTHEGAHLLGGLLAGLEVRSYQLLPPFWKGDFIHGYIRWHDGGSREAFVVSTAAAYVFDGVLLVVWAAVARLWRDAGPFAGALILALTCLRCVYDVSNNYLADTMLGGNGDVRFLIGGVPPFFVHAGAWILMIAGVSAAIHHIRSAR